MPTPSRDDIYRAVIRKMVAQALEEQERIFEQIHSQDSDQVLLDLLGKQAATLGHSPKYKEIPGWQLYEQRFGSWNEALAAAGLQQVGKYPVTKLPRYIEEENRQKEIYRQKKAEKKLRTQQRLQEQQRKQKESKKL